MMLPILDVRSLDATARKQAVERPRPEARQEVMASVRAILHEVRTRGDAALREFSARFDGPPPAALRVPRPELQVAADQLSGEVRDALLRAIANVRQFHEAQRLGPLSLETEPGVRCERLLRPIERVGIYVPAGSAPLPSALIMCAVPAALAGCPQRVLCTPARSGRVDETILAAAHLCGIDEVFAIGGAQAIGAMAYGTESVPKVDKIFGPGSAFVTAAKQLVAEDAAGAAIDLPAGPSEVLVVADDTARAAFVAADLLAQAEHDALAQAVLVTPSLALATEVRTAALTQLEALPRRELLDGSLQHSRLVVVEDLEAALELANAYAPEHLLLQVREPRRWLDRVAHAGSVFLGHWSPEPIGDYCSGTNHVLPTYGFARAYSGLSLLDFSKRITVQELTPAGLEALGPVARTLARVEGLEAHARAVEVRLEALPPEAS